MYEKRNAHINSHTQNQCEIVCMCQDYCERLYLTCASRVDVKTIVLCAWRWRRNAASDCVWVCALCPYIKTLGPKISMATSRRKTRIVRKRPEMLIRFHQKLPSPSQNILFVHSFHRLPLVCLPARLNVCEREQIIQAHMRNTGLNWINNGTKKEKSLRNILEKPIFILVV